MTFKRDALPFILYLGALTAISPLSIDMALPAFPQIGNALSARPDTIALSVSLFLLGFALGPLVLGPLSDRFGRRPVLLGGFVLFTLASLGCAMAQTADQFLFARLLQGCGAGAGGILPFVILRDLFEGHAARLRLSAITTVLGVGPIVAPLLGAGLLSFADWRGIFLFLALCGAVLSLMGLLCFAESSPPERRHPMSAGGMAKAYGQVIRNRAFLRYAILNAAAFASMFAYIAGSPTVLIDILGASESLFSILFACSAAAFMLGSAVNGPLVGRNGRTGRAYFVAALALLLGGGSILGLSLTGALTQIGFAVSAALAMFGCGLMAPSTIHDALHAAGKLAGVASAAFRFLQMLAAALASALVGALYDGRTAHSLGLVMLAVAVVFLVALMRRRMAAAAPMQG